MNIYYEGKVTQNDLYKILSFGAKQQPVASAVLYGGVVLFAALIGASLWRGFFTPAMVIPFMFFLLFAVYFFWTPYLGARRVFRNLEYIHHPINGWITGETVSVNSTRQEATLPWNKYRMARRASDLILLYQNENNFHFFPRMWFENDADWREFTAEIDRRIAERSLADAGSKGGAVLGSARVSRGAVLGGCVLPAALLIGSLVVAIWKGALR